MNNLIAQVIDVYRSQVKDAIAEEKESMMDLPVEAFSYGAFPSANNPEDTAENRYDDVSGWDFDWHDNAIYSYAVLRTLEWMLELLGGNYAE